MKIESLPVPAHLVQQYRERGITDLYPPQEECIGAGLFSGANLLIAIPTASGKTLVAEMAMHHHITGGGRCLYIVPLKALASEKYGEFDGKQASVGIATGDYDRRDEYLGRNDIIIATSEKVDSLLRNATHWLREISLLVVDEVHLIDSEDRGATLEMVITKLRTLNPAMQIVALSATIGNPEELAAWLDAELITSEWRPVDLREGVCYRDTVHFADGEKAIATPSRYEDINLCLDTIAEGGQCLVFVSSRKNAEGFAKRAASALAIDDPALDALGRELEAAAETEMGKVLAACVAKGAAFHHAGLSKKQRHIVERGFRKNRIKVISSTPTLAAGLNLPARRVVVRDHLRFQAGEGMRPIPVREYRQMAGRAGRPRLDPYGEAVLIAKERGAVDDLFAAYIEAPAEGIQSKCASESALTTHILSLIATGFVSSSEDLIGFLEKTFYVHQKKNNRHLSRIVESVTAFLNGAEMITDVGGLLHATSYGTLVSRLYIDPRGAEMISDALRSHEHWSEIGLLQLLCATPDMYTLYVRKQDLAVLEQFVEAHEDDLWVEFSWDDGESYFRSLKTAMLIADWMGEVGEAALCERYNVGPGDIYNTVEGIGWLIHAAGRIAGMAAPACAGPIGETDLRVKHGIKRELLPLIRLRGIGRVRARRLFNNNITSPEALRAAGMERISTILGQKTAESIFEQLGRPDGGDEDDEYEDVGQKTLSFFG
ncbi:MAG: ATP-dependent DNA helicase [Methanomicrobiaceae archaeon]|nr:ATP-dependent DNA helicase [Methanomicrobiaceae archaeon]